jgi:hypothetical protein
MPHSSSHDSASDGDLDLDLDMESIPLRNEGPEESLASHRQIPDLDDSDDSTAPRADGNRLGPLYDFLLPDDTVVEPPEEWTYEELIREFAEETENPGPARARRPRKLALVAPESATL